VHLVGFTIEIYYDSRIYGRQMCWILLHGVRRRFQLVNYNLREKVVLWIVG